MIDVLIRAEHQGRQTLPEASVFLAGGWFPPEQPEMLDGTGSIIEVDPRMDQVAA